MEAVAVIDLETLLGGRGKEVVKEVSVVGEYVQETFRYLPPYTMDRFFQGLTEMTALFLILQ